MTNDGLSDALPQRVTVMHIEAMLVKEHKFKNPQVIPRSVIAE
jgi:hypothetical protein